MKKITELILPIFIVGLFSLSSTTALAQAMPPLDNRYDDRRDMGESSQTDVYKELKTGEAAIPENVNKSLLAAMMQVIVNIYNLEETIAKS